MTEITLPRAVVEALVDPEQEPFVDQEFYNCIWCGRPFIGPPSTPNLRTHADSCPVRLAQEALRHQ